MMFNVTHVSLLIKNSGTFLATPGAGVVLSIVKKVNDGLDNWPEKGSLTLRREEVDFLIQLLDEDRSSSASLYTSFTGSQLVERELQVERKWSTHRLLIYTLTIRQATGPHNAPKQTGFVAFKNSELWPVVKVLRGFRDLMNAWPLFQELKYEGAVQSMALIFWSAYKRVGDREQVLRVWNDLTLLDSLAPLICPDASSTPSEELRRLIKHEEPISEFLFKQAEKLGMVFLASSIEML